MKKTILLLAVAAVCGTAQATILRVNNTTGSGAPYTTIDDALQAAQIDDTIMVDGSATSYGNITINKKVVLMGPGYWRAENGVSAEGANDATVGQIKVEVEAQGTVIRGMRATDAIRLNATYVVINRCRIGDIYLGVSLSSSADHTVIHQNYIEGRIMGYSNTTYANHIQITNNIFNGKSNDFLIKYINEGYIAYNTFVVPKYSGSIKYISYIVGCMLTKNILIGNENIDGNNKYVDNYMTEGWNVPIYKNRKSDLTIKNEQLSEEYATAIAGKGAFNGDDPYVISGIPAGPVIEDVTVPASVEQGNNLNITIKLGVQK